MHDRQFRMIVVLHPIRNNQQTSEDALEALAHRALLKELLSSHRQKKDGRLLV